MAQARLDDLTVLSRIWDSTTGTTECCLCKDGQKCIRVQVEQPDLQRSILLHMEKDLPVQMTCNRLEIFFPWQDGQSLDEWIYYSKPSLSQRRKMCMCLLEQMLTKGFPAELIALSARPENLRFLPDDAFLLIAPKLSDWEKGKEEYAVHEVAGLMAAIMTQKMEYGYQEQAPPELTVLLLRSAQGDYHSWGQVQSDLARIPEEPVVRQNLWTRLKSKLKPTIKKCLPVIQRIVAAVLAVLALISLFFAVVQWKEQKEAGDWPGIAVIGTEELE